MLERSGRETAKTSGWTLWTTPPLGSYPHPSPGRTGPDLPRYGLTALIVACAVFMETLDGTVISTSLPAIAADLHQDPITLKLALTSYLLSLAIFIPASGWAADRFGARTVFSIAISSSPRARSFAACRARCRSSSPPASSRAWAVP